MKITYTLGASILLYLRSFGICLILNVLSQVKFPDYGVLKSNNFCPK